MHKNLIKNNLLYPIYGGNIFKFNIIIKLMQENSKILDKELPENLFENDNNQI